LIWRATTAQTPATPVDDNTRMSNVERADKHASAALLAQLAEPGASAAARRRALQGLQAVSASSNEAAEHLLALGAAPLLLAERPRECRTPFLITTWRSRSP
jgi:hypothetical protein